MEKLVKWSKNIKVSDPFEEGCRLGPVVSEGQVKAQCWFVLSFYIFVILHNVNALLEPDNIRKISLMRVSYKKFFPQRYEINLLPRVISELFCFKSIIQIPYHVSLGYSCSYLLDVLQLLWSFDLNELKNVNVCSTRKYWSLSQRLKVKGQRFYMVVPDLRYIIISFPFFHILDAVSSRLWCWPLMYISQHLKKGFFIEPTIITDVTTSMQIWREEVFGPVLCVKTFSSEDEAIELANDSQ